MEQSKVMKAVKAFTTLEGASLKSLSVTTNKLWFKVVVEGICGNTETFFISKTHGVRTEQYARVIGLPR